MFQFVGRVRAGGQQVVDAGAGIAWIVVMALICYIGIEISAHIQYGLLGIELTMLIVFSVTALAKVYARQRRPPGRSTRPGRGSTRST